MAEDRISTPQSSTGLMRFDVVSSKVQIDPKIVLILAAIFVFAEIVLGLIFR